VSLEETKRADFVGERQQAGGLWDVGLRCRAWAEVGEWEAGEFWLKRAGSAGRILAK